MKILSFLAENVKRLTVVEIKPDGNMVQITGKNGQGKTSVLDSIWWALGGLTNVQTQPIREGQDTAKIRLDLGEIVVTRTFRKNDEGKTTSAIQVATASGARFPSPQAVLDDLIGKLTFDPLAFARMGSRDRFELLKTFVPNVPFAQIEQLNKEDFAKRTEVNRRAKEARVAADRISFPEGSTVDTIDVGELISKLEEAGKFNATLENRKSTRAKVEQEVLELRKISDEILNQAVAEATALRERAQKLMDDSTLRVQKNNQAADDLAERLRTAPELPEPIDTGALRWQITCAQEKNLIAHDVLTKAGLVALAEEAEAEAKKITEHMARRETDKQAQIAAAKLPVPDITLGDGEVLLKGLPFNQASDAEQLRASLAFAMAANPKLRVIRVRDGSLLDEDSLKIVEQMAIEKDYQVWIERVDSSGVGFVLEDGHLKEAPDASA